MKHEARGAPRERPGAGPTTGAAPPFPPEQTQQTCGSHILVRFDPQAPHRLLWHQHTLHMDPRPRLCPRLCPRLELPGRGAQVQGKDDTKEVSLSTSKARMAKYVAVWQVDVCAFGAFHIDPGSGFYPDMI